MTTCFMSLFEHICIFQMLKEQTRFIMEHFKQKECICFVPVPGQCGGGKECRVRALK